MTIAGYPSFLNEVDDDELLLLARRGDRNAYGELYARYERGARAYARSLLGADADADDAVAEVFLKVLHTVENGRGPQHTFAAYLFASVRHECGSIGRRNGRRTSLSGRVEASTHHSDHAAVVTEAAVVRSAFASLPDEMRRVLVLTEVDQLPHAEVATRLNAAPDAVAVRAIRARRALGSAYLEQHRAPPVSQDRQRSDCRDTRAGLVGYLRGTIGSRRRARVQSHLSTCAECHDEHAELQRMNGHLRIAGGPTVLMWIRALIESTHSAFSGAIAAAPASAATIVAAASMTVAIPAPTAFHHPPPILRKVATGASVPLEMAPGRAASTIVVVDDRFSGATTSGATTADPLDSEQAAMTRSALDQSPLPFPDVTTVPGSASGETPDAHPLTDAKTGVADDDRSVDNPGNADNPGIADTGNQDNTEASTGNTKASIGNQDNTKANPGNQDDANTSADANDEGSGIGAFLVNSDGAPGGQRHAVALQGQGGHENDNAGGTSTRDGTTSIKNGVASGRPEARKVASGQPEARDDGHDVPGEDEAARPVALSDPWDGDGAGAESVPATTTIEPMTDTPEVVDAIVG